MFCIKKKSFALRFSIFFSKFGITSSQLEDTRDTFLIGSILIFYSQEKFSFFFLQKNQRFEESHQEKKKIFLEESYNIYEI